MIDIKTYEKLSNLLREFCIPKNLLGYKYIISGVNILFKNPEISITNLYSEIAKEHNSEPSRVERAIRHAIERGYDNCIDCHFDTFRRVCYNNKRPSNSEFLQSVAIELRLQESINY